MCSDTDKKTNSQLNAKTTRNWEEVEKKKEKQNDSNKLNSISYLYLCECVRKGARVRLNEMEIR